MKVGSKRSLVLPLEVKKCTASDEGPQAGGVLGRSEKKKKSSASTSGSLMLAGQLVYHPHLHLRPRLVHELDWFSL